MDALEVILANMIQQVKDPVTSSTGGTSKGDPSAGGSSTDDDDAVVEGVYYDISQSDKAGAGILTALLGLTTMGGAAWLLRSS